MSILNKLKKLYLHKYTPRFFYKKFDGGKDSGVVGYFLIEWKPILSIGLLRFNEGSRENYHSHAFNAITWWLSGKVEEETYRGIYKVYSPSLKPKITKRSKVHRVKGINRTWAFTIRGPWKSIWYEISPGDSIIKLTHGRKVVND